MMVESIVNSTYNKGEKLAIFTSQQTKYGLIHMHCSKIAIFYLVPSFDKLQTRNPAAPM